MDIYGTNVTGIPGAAAARPGTVARFENVGFTQTTDLGDGNPWEGQTYSFTFQNVDAMYKWTYLGLYSQSMKIDTLFMLRGRVDFVLNQIVTGTIPFAIADLTTLAPLVPPQRQLDYVTLNPFGNLHIDGNIVSSGNATTRPDSIMIGTNANHQILLWPVKRTVHADTVSLYIAKLEINDNLNTSADTTVTLFFACLNQYSY
jgi:hypothetical protein